MMARIVRATSPGYINRENELSGIQILLVEQPGEVFEIIINYHEHSWIHQKMLLNYQQVVRTFKGEKYDFGYNAFTDALQHFAYLIQYHAHESNKLFIPE
jgi:hypothetical protein